MHSVISLYRRYNEIALPTHKNDPFPAGGGKFLQICFFLMPPNVHRRLFRANHNLFFARPLRGLDFAYNQKCAIFPAYNQISPDPPPPTPPTHLIWGYPLPQFVIRNQYLWRCHLFRVTDFWSGPQRSIYSQN